MMTFGLGFEANQFVTSFHKTSGVMGVSVIWCQVLLQENITIMM